MKKKLSYCDRIRQLRKERGFSQEQIALRAEITTSYFGQIERGQANPSVDLLEKICEVMNVKIADIFTDTNTNLLGIDAFSMQILSQLNGKSDKEKEIILGIIKDTFKLQEISKCHKHED